MCVFTSFVVVARRALSSVRSSFPRAFRHACHMLTARERPRSSENIMMVIVIVCRPARLAIGRRANAKKEPERSKQILRRFSEGSRGGGGEGGGDCLALRQSLKKNPPRQIRLFVIYIAPPRESARLNAYLNALNCARCRDVARSIHISVIISALSRH